MFEVSQFNILILGNTGVRKSTLVYTIIKTDLEKMDNHKPSSMGIQISYEYSEDAKEILMWDSRGKENGQYNIESANKENIETIN